MSVFATTVCKNILSIDGNEKKFKIFIQNSSWKFKFKTQIIRHLNLKLNFQILIHNWNCNDYIKATGHFRMVVTLFEDIFYLKASLKMFSHQKYY